jgi:cephalosporin-C deacetylase-like acetyl esterase
MTKAPKNPGKTKRPFSRPFRAFAIFAFGAWCVSASAQTVAKDGYELSVSVDRDGATYRKGEPVVFTIVMTKDGAPAAGAEIRHMISKDGVALPGRPVEKTLLPADGRLTVTGRLDEPGFLQCLVEFFPQPREKMSSRAAAAVEPLAIPPSMPVPEDFDAFWAAQKKRLAAVPLNLRLTPVKTPAKGVELFDAQADGVEGPMSGYLARPAGAKPKSLPGIVLTHGAGVNSSRPGSAVKWAAEGFVALDFNVHGLPNGKPAAFYTELRNGALKNYNTRGSGSRDTVYFRQVFLRLLRAIDTVAAQPEWDGAELIVFGRSQGGGQAIVAGGLDTRVTFVSAEMPALCDHTGFAAGRINGWPKFIPTLAKTPDSGVAEAVRYYDCVNFATRIPPGMRVSMTVGFIDVTCPPTGVYAAYNQVRGKKQMWDHTDTGHVGRADYEQRMHDEVITYLKKTPENKKAQK